MSNVKLFEVGPRDGFQNLQDYVPAEVKLDLIDRMVQSGLKHLQCTSFVSPKAIPQMRDAKEVAAACVERYPDADLFALIPNLYGAKAARDSGIRSVDMVISLSKSHNQANINRTHEQSFAELQNVLDNCPEMKLTVDIATAFGCPFEGIPAVASLVDFIGKIRNYGIRNFTLGDTIGVANPVQVRETVKALLSAYPDCVFRPHFHDTRNNGIANTIAAIECGITEVETTLGGLGGCPFAPGASGNTATEDLIWLLDKMGYETGVSFEKVLEAAQYEHSILVGNYSGHQMNITKRSACCG